MNCLAAFTLAFSLMAAPAFAALDLHSARAQGLVGEQRDGYVAALKPSSDVNALVQDVNSKRRAQYNSISKQNGQPLSVVGTVAAEEIINGLEPGAQYQDASGNWAKR